MTVIDFKPEHLEQIKLKAIHSGEVPKTVMHTAVSVMDGEKPVAIFGGFHFIPGVIHIWGLISDDVREKPLAFHKIVRHLIDFYEKKTGPRRIQMEVKSDYQEGKKWAEALGFECEGTMKRWGFNGESYDLYARMNPWVQ